MVKCEVIEEFTLKRFKELKNLKRKRVERDGKLNAGDIFECTKEMAEYLTGNNPLNKQVVRIIEIIPEEEKEDAKTIEDIQKKEKVTKEIKEETKPKKIKNKKKN